MAWDVVAALNALPGWVKEMFMPPGSDFHRDRGGSPT